MNADSDARTRQWMVYMFLALTMLWTGQTLADVREPEIPEGASLKSWYNNGSQGIYILDVMEGLPSLGVRQLEGVVLSDGNCRPDANGLSHCHNRVELSNGRQITVVNNHQMSRNRCLKPGDRLSFSALNDRWLTGRRVR